jgi:geranylgeranyl diphosphate synthase, type I
VKQFVDYLSRYNKEVQPVIDSVFAKAKQHGGKYDPVTLELIEDYGKLMQEGKRIRGCLVILGYEMFGGEKKDQIMQASVGMEVIHSALLIHDDIMDQDNTRRGMTTLHKKYEQAFGEHYGQSMAMAIGDIGLFLGMDLITSLNLPAENRINAAQYLSRRLTQVGLGQALDITFQQTHQLSEKKVLLVHELKTAEYTFSAPLTLGALLAGMELESLKAIEQYGIPVGQAFQLRDDELGLFSTEKTLGKPIGSDIKSGKVTLLAAIALQNSSPEDKQFLEKTLGNPNATNDDIKRAQEIVRSSKALEYSQKLSKELVEKGKKSIDQITQDPIYQGYLSQLADLGIERQS